MKNCYRNNEGTIWYFRIKNTMKKVPTLISKNKKAYFDYEIVDNWEAWVVLKWYETKSVRNGHVNLKWSYIISENGELYVKWMHITPRKSLSNKKTIDPIYPRKILLKKKTILFLLGKMKEKGYSIIPLELYFSWSLIKVKVGLAKWKKLHQKKQLLKERTLDREAKKAMMRYF